MTPAPIRVMAALMLLSLVVPAAAGTATPGTGTPHSSGDWGTTEADVRDYANDMFLKLVAAAREGVVVGGEKIVYTKAVVMEIDLDNMVIGGSPAAAFAAGRGLNSAGKTIGGKDHSGHDLVYTTSALYTMADRPEAGVFIAHELGHLARGHAERIEDAKAALIDALYTEWSHESPADIDRINADPQYSSEDQRTSAMVRAFFRAKAAKLERQLIPVQAPLEAEADEYGRELAVKAGIPMRATVSSFKRAQDWLWALRLDMSDETHGGSVADRAAKNVKWIADRRAASKRAATALRRANAATQGMSVP